jgi:hypothetical protein
MGWLANFASSVWDAVCGIRGAVMDSIRSLADRVAPRSLLKKIKPQNSHSLAGCDSLIAGPGVGAGGL